jgi:flagellar FliL protein
MAKAPSKKEEKADEAAGNGEAQPAKRKVKLPLVIGLVVLLAAAGGGWFFFSKGKGEEAAQQQAKPQPPKPPVFVPLDAFTVNLAAEQSEQYLQAAATLKVLDQAAADATKLYMPEVRHKMLVLLSAKKPSEVGSAAGRERLAEEMRQTINNILLAAAGRPVRPIALDVPKQGEGMAAGSNPEPKPEAEAKPEEAAKPQEGAPAEAGAPAAPPAAAAAAPAPKPATELAKAAPDDPVQSVFFTAFIIQ